MVNLGVVLGMKFASNVSYPILVLNIGYLIWHSLVDILAVYLVLYLWGGTLLSVTLTWIIAMVTYKINKASSPHHVSIEFVFEHSMSRRSVFTYFGNPYPIDVNAHAHC